MKLTEVFAKAGIESDQKARRVLNTSDAVARVSAEEIESGVTIERLEDIGVPVYKYATQVTIHGSLPDFNEASRPAGYKAIFKNGNGTVGVRYVAIDGEKKTRLVHISRLSVSAKSGKADHWSAHLASDGLTVSRFFETKDACLEAFKSFPRDRICGGVVAGAGALGGFYVIAYVGAIYEANFWAVTQSLWGIATPETVAELEAAREKAGAESRARFEAEAANRRAELAVKAEQFKSEVTLKAITSIPMGPCQFVRLVRGFSGPELALITVAKRGARLCYTHEVYKKTDDTYSPRPQWKIVEPKRRENWIAACARGEVYRPE